MSFQFLVEYDLAESMKESRGLVVNFSKRISQISVPIAMALIFNSRARETQILVADRRKKFKFYDVNTFELLATCSGPALEVRQMVRS